MIYWIKQTLVAFVQLASVTEKTQISIGILRTHHQQGISKLARDQTVNKTIMCMYECKLLYIAFVFEWFSAPCFIELLSYYKTHCMFHVKDEPEGKFLYTETMKLYCVKQ